MKVWESVFDNHMHLRHDGFNIEAARMFEREGGTAFNLVNLPDYTLPADHYYERIYDNTVRMAERVRKETGIKVIVTLGPYPLDYLHFSSQVDDAGAFMMRGIDTAMDLILKGDANAIGEIGRPHFETDGKTVEAANGIIEYAMERAREHEIPVVLHTEDLSSDSYRELGEMARRCSFDTGKLVKHHAHPSDFQWDSNLVKSVLASRRNVRDSIGKGQPFFLETDYVDEKEKPGKVIPPDSVPRRAVMIKNQYENWEEIFESMFRTLPNSVYGDDLIE